MNTSQLDITTLNTSQMEPELARLRSIALGMGIVGLVLVGLGIVMGMANQHFWTYFFTSYLMSYLFWLAVTTGSLGWLLVHNVVGGGWGFIMRRFLEAATRLLPLMAVLYVPMFFGLDRIYAWPHPGHDRVLLGQTWWMNLPFFLARIVIMFAFWGTVAFFINKWSAAQDTVDDPMLTHRLNMLSAPAIPVFVLSVTCLAIDWVMVLTPHWVSSIIGFLFVVGQGLSTLALMAILVTVVTSGEGIQELIPDRYFRDIGNFTLAFTMLWGYMSFSQYLITYSGNQAEESSWYVERSVSYWPIIGFSLIGLHFALPFLTLLSSTVKTRIRNLARLGCFILFMRLVDLYWWTAPHFRGLNQINAVDVGLPLAMGGLWLTLWTMQMKDRQLLPKYDTRWQAHWAAHLHDAHKEPGRVTVRNGEVMEHGH